MPAPKKQKFPMNVSLTPELERLINEKVVSGRYQSASEVVREALRLLEERDYARRGRMEQLRSEIARGMEQVERGRVRPLNIARVRAEGRKRLAAQRKG